MFKSFSGLFGEGDEQEGFSDFSESAQFAKRWGWYQSIYILAKGDIAKFDDVTSQPLIKSLTLLTFEKEKSDIEYRELQKKLKQ